MLAKDEHCTHEHQDRPEGIDGTLDGERQILDGKVAEQPRCGNYNRLDEQQQVVEWNDEIACAVGNGVDEEWRHEQGAEERVEKENSEHIVPI